MPIPLSDGLVGKPMRFSRQGPQNITEAKITKVGRRGPSLSIVHLESRSAPPLSMGDLLVLQSLDGQYHWEADVRFHGNLEFREGYDEKISIIVHVRDAGANRGPNLLPQKNFAILVQPIPSSTYHQNDNWIAAALRGANKATLDEADGARRKIKIGIKGYGRIERAVAKLALESEDVELVAINDPSITTDHMTCMFRDKRDHWFRSDFKIKDSNTLTFGDVDVTIFRIKESMKIPWNDAGAEYIVEAFVDECDLDFYKTRASNNYNHYTSSNGDIFKHCLSPLAEILHKKFGMFERPITTCRAPLLYIQPQNLNAAKAVSEKLPRWKGMHSGLIFRVPAVDAPPIDLAIELAPFHDYKLILSNTKPSFGFHTVLTWCVQMTRQIPQITYCEMTYGAKS